MLEGLSVSAGGLLGCVCCRSLGGVLKIAGNQFYLVCHFLCRYYIVVLCFRYFGVGLCYENVLRFVRMALFDACYIFLQSREHVIGP